MWVLMIYVLIVHLLNLWTPQPVFSMVCLLVCLNGGWIDWWIPISHIGSVDFLFFTNESEWCKTNNNHPVFSSLPFHHPNHPHLISEHGFHWSTHPSVTCQSNQGSAFCFAWSLYVTGLGCMRCVQILAYPYVQFFFLVAGVHHHQQQFQLRILPTVLPKEHPPVSIIFTCTILQRLNQPWVMPTSSCQRSESLPSLCLTSSLLIWPEEWWRSFAYDTKRHSYTWPVRIGLGLEWWTHTHTN